MQKRRTIVSLTAMLVALLLPLAGHAQMSGSNTKGDFGLMAGTQAPPGFYVIPLFYDYTADALRDENGDRVSPIAGGGFVDARAAIAGLMWVTEKKFLGGTYGFSIWPGVTNNALGFPPLEVDEKVSTGVADLYIQPIILGWNTDRADYLAGLGIYAPTGEYEAGGDSNRGLGMWTYELYGATTVYFDEAKSWHFAAFAAYETHGKKGRNGYSSRRYPDTRGRGSVSPSWMEQQMLESLTTPSGKSATTTSGLVLLRPVAHCSTGTACLESGPRSRSRLRAKASYLDS